VPVRTHNTGEPGAQLPSALGFFSAGRGVRRGILLWVSRPTPFPCIYRCVPAHNISVNWIALVVFLLFLVGYIVTASTGVTNRKFDQVVGGGVLVGIGAFAVVAIVGGFVSALLSLF
jgi:hypothetical protein